MRGFVGSMVVVIGLAGSAGGSAEAAGAGDPSAVPYWNSHAHCHALMTAQRQDLHFFEDCTERESDAAAQVESLWPGLSAEARAVCLARATTPAGGSYRILFDCGRAARDGGATPRQ